MSRAALFRELFDLDGRVALVTGGTMGLGRMAARTLSAAGARVALCSRHGADAARVAGEIAADTGGRVLGLEADVAAAGDVARLVGAAEAELGPVDILLAAAGINIRKSTEELTEADWDAVIGVNLKGAFLCARAVLPGMCRRGWGRVVLFGSMLSHISLPGRAAYASSKTALLGLARTLALEAAPHGVCVNAVCPGPFRTPMNLPVYGDEEKNRAFLARLPVGRWGEPDELRGLLLYLASPASSFMTGADLVIDGGWTAQ